MQAFVRQADALSAMGEVEPALTALSTALRLDPLLRRSKGFQVPSQLQHFSNHSFENFSNYLTLLDSTLDNFKNGVPVYFFEQMEPHGSGMLDL
jgi:hypothetical protein